MTHGAITHKTIPLGTGKHRVPRPAWVVACAPHVAVRLKRVFARVNTWEHGTLTLSDTPETCRELAWFLQRFPLEMSDADRARLDRRAAEHEATEQAIAWIIAGEHEPTQRFDLAIPLRDYQKQAGELLLRTSRLLLADDVGIGKTASAIGIFTDPRTLPALVVTLTHLPRQWEAEIGRFAPRLKVHILKGTRPYRLDGAKAGEADGHPKLFDTSSFPDVIISNYHKLSGWAETLAPRVRSVVFDEGHELRRIDSAKYRAARHLAEHAAFRMACTATPIFNYGGEMFSVLDVLAPDTLGTREEFLREWCADSWGDKARVKDPQAFGAYLRDAGLMLRRTRAEVGRELPPLTKVPHAIDADLREIEHISGEAAELARIILAHGGAPVAKMQAAGELDWKLRRATGLAKAPYVAEFVRLLVESGEKVLLYGWHIDVYGILKERLKDLAPAFYTGAESPTQKDEAKRRFVAGETPLLIMSLRSGAGIDGLQGSCRTVVFGELDWSPACLEQCVGRIHRDGQAEPVVAYFLVSDHGSDPIMADVLGIKRQQLEGIRDPAAPAVEKLEVDPEHIKKLAERFLRDRGIEVPAKGVA